MYSILYDGLSKILELLEEGGEYFEKYFKKTLGNQPLPKDRSEIYVTNKTYDYSHRFFEVKIKLHYQFIILLMNYLFYLWY